MPDLSENSLAPDFALEDTQGNTVRLSDYVGKQVGNKHVVLVLTRGFM